MMSEIIQKQFEKIKVAARLMNLLTDEEISKTLNTLAESLLQKSEIILVENAKDLDNMDPLDARYDRLKLTAERIRGMAQDVLSVANMPSPLGKIHEQKELENGLTLKKISVPLGVVGIIYEARPNVTTDVFSLCFKSGNACLLKGGSDAFHTNSLLTKLIQEVLLKTNIAPEVVQLLPPGREATQALMQAVGIVDVLIPRGSQSLINAVREQSRVPVIETGAGIVHTYFDASGDLKKGQAIVLNAKTRRVSVCNSLDCLIVHKDRLQDLPVLVEKLAKFKVDIYADQASFALLIGNYPDDLLHRAEPEHYGTEFLDYKMSIKTVKDFTEALAHINRYSSKHSEAIIAEEEMVIDQFYKSVDAAAVYANTSTAFTDGSQFGMGAEIGISTQKLHARGPMALNELTSYKWIIRGNGQIRPV